MCRNVWSSAHRLQPAMSGAGTPPLAPLHTSSSPKTSESQIFVPYTAEHEYIKEFKQAHRRDDDIAIVNAGIRIRMAPSGEQGGAVDWDSLHYACIGGWAAPYCARNSTAYHWGGMKPCHRFCPPSMNPHTPPTLCFVQGPGWWRTPPWHLAASRPRASWPQKRRPRWWAGRWTRVPCSARCRRCARRW